MTRANPMLNSSVPSGAPTQRRCRGTSISEIVNAMPEGPAKDQVNALFPRHAGKERIDRALWRLSSLRCFDRYSHARHGRPSTRWEASGRTIAIRLSLNSHSSLISQPLQGHIRRSRGLTALAKAIRRGQGHTMITRLTLIRIVRLFRSLFRGTSADLRL